MKIDLKKLLKRIKSNGIRIKIENREVSGLPDYGFPKKHGEILNYINIADNDYWDGLILGYRDYDYEYDTVLKTSNLLGIIFVENGNHKLLFKISHKRGFSQKLFEKEVKKFIFNYRKAWGLNVKYLDIKI